MDNFNDFILGAYATSPCLLKWDEQKEIEYIEALKRLNSIRGLELPFWGDSIHLYNEELFLSLLDKKWKYVLTTLPGNMEALKKNIHFGLASDDENGRLEAIKFYKKASDTIKKINNYLGKQKVISVVIATAPSLTNKAVSSSIKSFEKSLKKLLTFDWHGAKLVIEHCDSGRVKNPVKGFLSIDEEIEAINNINVCCNTNIGLSINWARSAIELKDENAPLVHIKKALDNDILSGLMFSGTSDKESDYGIWSDLHMPISKEDNIANFEETSLLTKQNILNCLKQSNYKSLDYLGIKVLSMPINESSLQRRIGINIDTMKVINKAIKDIK